MKKYLQRHQKELNKLSYASFLKWVEIYTHFQFEKIKDECLERMIRGDKKFGETSYLKTDKELSDEALQELEDFINYNLIIKCTKKNN